MPNFEITGPDGKKYRVTAPEGASQQEVLAYVQQNAGGGAQPPRFMEQRAQNTEAPTPPPEQPSTFMDVAKSGVTGLARGVTGMATLPRTLGDMVAPQAGPDGQPPSREDAIRRGVYNQTMSGISPFTSMMVNLPTFDSVMGAVTAPFGGEYEPQTTAGKYSRTIGEFAPAAIGGPGGLLARGMRVVAPAVASEAAGQATEGTALETPARIIGGLAGGLAGAGAERLARNLTRGREVIPTGDALESSARVAYKEAEDAGVMIRGDAMRTLARDLQNTARQSRYNEGMHTGVATALREFGKVRRNTSLLELDTLRGVAQAARGSKDRNERRIAGILVDKIDDFMDNLPQNALSARNAETASAALQRARPLWARAAKAKEIERAIERAKDTALNQNNPEMALANQFRAIARNENRMRRFTSAEQEAIRAIGRGDFSTRALRQIARYAPQNILNWTTGGSAVGGLAAIMGGPAAGVAGLAVPAAGLMARQAVTARTGSRARQLAEMMRRGGPAPRTYKPSVSLSAARGGALAGMSEEEQ